MGGNEDEADKEVTIKVFSNLPDRKNGQGLVEQMIIDEYMAANSNVTVEAEALDEEAYKTKFKAYAMDGMPDIMFLDVQMPLKDGIEVMQEAKRAEILPYTMILSAYDEFKYCQQALRLGAKEYILKPVRSSDLLQMVNRAADVAERVSISAGYLSTLFQKQLSKGFVDYLNGIRIEHACTYLQQNYLKTYEIAYRVGFKDEKYFSKVFKKIKGQSPSEYRKSHQ